MDEADGPPTGAGPGQEWTNGLGMVFVFVPPGEFLMGGADPEAEEWEGPVHPVRIERGFWLGKYPVTQDEWTAVMGTNPSRNAGDGRLPVTCVTWQDSCGFLVRLGQRDGMPYRLPTEAEWEYACRAGSAEGRYGPVADVAWIHDDEGRCIRVVGRKLPNAWGFHDTLGNVWEWCRDVWHETYEGAPADGSAWETGGTPGDRVCRGGSGYLKAFFSRAGARNGLDAGVGWSVDVGLRVALSAAD